MAWTTTRIALASAAVVAIVATGASAQISRVYRYVDGTDALSIRSRTPWTQRTSRQRMRINVIEDNTTSAAQQAQRRFPVTLYSFTCGEVCSQAEALLNRRGVPFSTVNVETPEGAEQLNKMTGELRAPVLQVGDRTFVKGYSEKQWNSALDDAGYPKAQPPRRTAPSRAPTTESASAAAAAETSEPRAVNAPAQYPRQ